MVAELLTFMIAGTIITLPPRRPDLPKEPPEWRLEKEVCEWYRDDEEEPQEEETAEEITYEEEPEVYETTTEGDAGMYYYATLELTAYIATGNPCAVGAYPQVGYTVASNDPALWHRRIHIEGYGDYYVHDTGGMASNVLDVFYGDDYDGAIQFGRRTADVYVYE
jgi:3D (Asp-Asp-Asp) domain-containing protein